MDGPGFAPLPAFAGGIAIGLALVLVLLWNGKIAGISGVLSRAMAGVQGDTRWRLLFLAGLVAGAFATFRLIPSSAAFTSRASTLQLISAGFLVGLGTRIGGGCTSGHGVCGMARGSRRSIVATLVFMAAGFATVYVARHLIGGGA